VIAAQCGPQNSFGGCGSTIRRSFGFSLFNTALIVDVGRSIGRSFGTFAPLLSVSKSQLPTEKATAQHPTTH